jgi:RNA polymerase sigma-70 factor (ECF subfamily)
MHDVAPTAREELSCRLEADHAAYFGWALACCAGRREEAEEALQTAYLKVLDGRAVFSGRSSFRTWMLGVIRWSAVEVRRRTRWRRWIGLDRLDARDAGDAARPDLQAVRNERTAAVRRALARLSSRQREVLHLVFYHGLSIEAAAEVLGVAAGTARTHYQRGKAALRKRLME